MPHINAEALREYIQGDDDLLADLATMFVQALPDCKARLRFSVRSHDAGMLREATHQLASRLGYFQAEGLRELAKRLEQFGITNHLDGVRELVDQLIPGLDELVSELRQLTKLSLRNPEDD
jgi:HPt (histidine-containing phosphotransfer) domain-containing protein